MDEVQTQTVNGIAFSLLTTSHLYYATAMNGQSFIQELSVSNESGAELNDIEITLWVTVAGVPVCNPWLKKLGTLGRVRSVDTNLSLAWDSSVLFQQADIAPGEVRCAVSVNGEVYAETFWSIEVLPANYWMPDTVNEYKTLAAFVQPNAPALRPILDKAIELLGKMGQDQSLNGYSHSDPDKLVEALYEAVKAQNIAYSFPKPSWDIAPGQVVRLAEDIQNEHVGTCLDTAVLFASLLEVIWLNPVLVVVPGHAFVGYWTKKFFNANGNEAMPQESLLPVVNMMNYLDLGYIRLFETTLICTSDTPVSFSEATVEGIANLSRYQALGSGSYSSIFIDVLACRKDRSAPVHSLPALVKHPDGTVEIVEYRPTEFNIAMLRTQLEKETSGTKRVAQLVNTNVPPRVKMWLEQLLDLSLRNPLINFKNPESSIPLLTSRGALGHIEDLLQRDEVLRVEGSTFIASNQNGEVKVLDLPEDDRGQVVVEAEKLVAGALAANTLLAKLPNDTVLTKLRKMVNNANLVQQETGSNGLFLALGMLNWRPKSSNESFAAPLLLIPVRLTSKNRGKDFFLSIDDSGVTPNFSLVEKLKQEHGLDLKGLTNLAADDHGIDVDGTFQHVREELQKAGLIDFRVDEKAVLGFFNFSSYRLWRDLLDNWSTYEKTPLVQHFIHTPGEAFIEPVQTEPSDDLDDLIARLPIPADGSQATAVSKAMAGHSFVLQGPPGTGKSQTIANLLARALHEGKRVLFVAQKQDALEVVKERLEKVGLGAFTLDLFDKASTSRAVREQLAAVLDVTVRADRVGFETAVSEYDGTLPPIVDYKNRLHESNRFGESLYSTRKKLLAVPGEKYLLVTGEFIADYGPEDKDAILSATKALAKVGPLAGNAQDNVWSLTGLQGPVSGELLKRISNTVEETHLLWASLKENSTVFEFIKATEDSESLNYLQALQTGNRFPFSVEYARNTRGSSAINRVAESLNTLSEGLATLKISPLRLANLDVEFWLNQVQLAIAGSSLLRNFKLKGMRKKISLQCAGGFDGAPTSLLTDLENLRRVKKQIEAALTDIKAIDGYRNTTADELLASGGIEAISLDFADILSLAQFANVVRPVGPQPSALLKSLNNSETAQLLKFVDSTKVLLSEIAANESSIALWTGGRNFWDTFSERLSAMAEDARVASLTKLTFWVDVLSFTNELQSRKLDQAVEQVLSGAVGYEFAANAFLKGFYSQLLNNLVATRGFSAFNPEVLNNQITKLSDAHEGIRERLPRILGSELLARRGFDSSMRVGAIGDLIQTVKQGKRNLPLRTMLSKHWEVITQVAPLVLASPDSCVRFIDAQKEPFDLVVFDEASQIRVATAIGALGRAKAAVVVGDSEQMPPTSVGQSKIVVDEEAEDDQVMSADVESILALCEVARVPEIMLTWHFRSDDEALIAFSNHNYYGGKLHTFPSAPSAGSPVGLQYRPVDGQFIRSAQVKPGVRLGTNPVEAQAIVSEIATRLADPETALDSIGVVTLNQPQSKYILDLLQTSENKLIAQAMDSGINGQSIFVKNLETVQGSERDVILFSVAFSAKPEAPRDLPLQFGPIVNAGGHKRLNVAITRARKQLIVFNSFEPKLLEEKKPVSKGLQDLARFLVLASSTDKSDFFTISRQEEEVDLHRRDIKKRLSEAGLEVTEQEGLSDFKVDLAVKDPAAGGRFVLGILLDGDGWSSRKTVIDRDSLPVSLLTTRMGWPAVVRIWLPAWLRDSEGEVRRIVAAYESARKNAKAPSVSKQPAKLEQIFEQKVAKSDGSFHGAENPINRMLRDHKVWASKKPMPQYDSSNLDYLHDKNVQKAIIDLAEELAAVEGPVSRERLAKYVGASFNMSRVVSNRIEAINGIPYLAKNRDSEGFFFPKGETQTTYSSWQRATVEEPRKIEEISLKEIGNAMSSFASASQGIRAEQLFKEVVNAFGIQKLTSNIQARLDKALKQALLSKSITRNGDYLVS